MTLKTIGGNEKSCLTEEYQKLEQDHLSRSFSAKNHVLKNTYNLTVLRKLPW
jgi:hypothetical protein